jgi:phosphoenolpyruvate carboxylase
MAKRLDPDLKLRAEVRLVGEVLGLVIREQEGRSLYALVERVRGAAIELRRGDEPGEERKVRRLIAQLDLDEVVAVARAFTLFFQLVNVCEQRHTAQTHGPSDPGSAFDGLRRMKKRGVRADAIEAALAGLRTTVVLTAHPTEATRWSVHESLARVEALLAKGSGDGETPLAEALAGEITMLWQTQIQRSRAPTPIDEVRQAIHTLETVLFDAVPAVHQRLTRAFEAVYGRALATPARPVRLGSWVGGDRDGNPNVTPWVTADALRLYKRGALAAYWRSLQPVIQEMTASDQLLPVFAGLRESLARDLFEVPRIDKRVAGREVHEVYRRKLNAMAVRLEIALEENDARDLPGARGGYPDAAAFVADLDLVDASLRANRGARIADGRLATLREQAASQGFKLASLDVREHQARHREAVDLLLSPATGALSALPDEEQARFLEDLFFAKAEPLRSDAELPALAREVLGTMQLLRDAQRFFDHDALRDVVISNSHSHCDVLEVLVLARQAGLVRRRHGAVGFESDIDVVPLFETVGALAGAADVMERLYDSPAYQEQLRARGRRQQIMLGYSDSTKDGGYFAANFALWRAQVALTAQSDRNGVEVEFFHGRGGTISRGGGPTHRAILAQPVGTVRGRIKITEQGEVIASKYGSVPSAVHHLERLVTATLEATVAHPLQNRSAKPGWIETMTALSEESRRAYRALVYDTPGFVEIFHAVTPIEEIAQLRIGSRPSRRVGGGSIDELRAIPWNFAWNQNRILLSSWYGAGTGLEAVLSRPGGRGRLQAMYRGWPFFRSVIDNLQQVLAKVDLRIGASYAELAADLPGASDMVARVAEEFRATQRGVLAVVDTRKLLATEPVLGRSIERRSPYVDVLSYLQLELLRRKREGRVPPRERERVDAAIQLTISGIAAGLRNTG